MDKAEKKDSSTIVDYDNLGLSLLYGEDDCIAIKKLITKIIPLFKGHTLSQIEQALKSSLDTFKSGYIIK